MSVTHIPPLNRVCHLCPLTAQTTCATCGKPTCASHLGKQDRHYICVECLNRFDWLGPREETRSRRWGRMVKGWIRWILDDI